MGMRFDKVDPRLWAELGAKVGTAYVQNKAGDANAEGMKQSTQTTSNYGKADPNAVYTGEGADGTMTAAEAASFGVNVPMEDKTAGTGVIRQYGLGTNPQKFQDAEFTSEQQRLGGLKSQAAFYAARGDTDQSNKILSQIQQSDLTDMQLSQAKRMGLREDKADDNTAIMEGVDKETGAKDLARRTGPDGVVRDMTIDDHLHNSQVRASLLTKAGKISEAGQVIKDYNAQSFAKIQLDTEQRNQDLGRAASALANGDATGIKDFYNKHVPDGAHVTNVTEGKDGLLTIERTTVDGQPMPPVTKNRNELLAGLNSFKDPMALYNFSQNEFKNNLAINADKRADKSLSIQQAQLGIQAGSAAVSNEMHRAQIGQITEVTANKKELNSIHADISAAIDAGDTKAENAARKKLMTYTIGSKGTSMTKLESEANLYFASGKAKSMADAIEMAHQKVQSSPKDDYIKLTTGAMPRSPDDLERDMTTLHGVGWKDKISPPSASASRPITQAEFDKLPSGAVYTNSKGGRSQKP